MGFTVQSLKLYQDVAVRKLQSKRSVNWIYLEELEENVEDVFNLPKVVFDVARCYGARVSSETKPKPWARSGKALFPTLMNEYPSLNVLRGKWRQYDLIVNLSLSYFLNLE